MINNESSDLIVLQYRLTEADVRRYAGSGLARSCRRVCRRQGWGLLLVLAIGLGLLSLLYRAHGPRSVALMLAVSTLVLGFLGWLRQDRLCRKECRLARDLGVPLDVHLSITPGGITKDPSDDDSDPSRTFRWSEVVEVGRVNHLTVVRLRPAGAVLLIPDRAFADEPARERCLSALRAWRVPRSTG